jgi:hypothetical protein
VSSINNKVLVVGHCHFTVYLSSEINPPPGEKKLQLKGKGLYGCSYLSLQGETPASLY